MTSPSVPAQHGARLTALDAFRGITIAAMILVNNPGSWSHVYPPLRHAAWHGCTPTDLIFPFFLFIVGVAMAYALPRHLEAGRPGRAFWGRVLRRTALLIGLGLVLNAFSPAWRGLASGDPGVFVAELATVRLPGVLQRIGLVYLIACILIVTLPRRAVVMVGVGILIAHPVAMWLYQPSNPFAEEQNLSRAIDVALIGPSNLYAGSPTDPEGLLGTFPAVVSALCGYWCGTLLRKNPVTTAGSIRLISLGLLGVAAGWLLSYAVPLNKPLWTTSYTVYSSGWAVLMLGACLIAFDQLALPAGRAFALLGRHAITVFVGSGLLARIITLLPGPGEHATIKACITSGPESVLSPVNASLVFAAGTVMLWWGIATLMDRRGWMLKV